ncbi:frataxin domain-containing protein [Rickettsiales endosymbiont of Stachyamoeba lipophora]|uniref:frataxin domain-containing protein n=1 Tax=Rickettsiales endosymbiont of Stachyamoeba lipophora TaxID=2486578 RepID=UPI0013DDBDCD
MNVIAKAKEEIEVLFDLIDAYDEYEVDLTQGILYIETDFGSYVINVHEVMQELWVSSPKTGAHHFKFDIIQQQWITAKNKELRELFTTELNIKF